MSDLTLTIIEQLNDLKQRVADLLAQDAIKIDGTTGLPYFTALTAGSVLFAGTSGILAQDNSNLSWNTTTKQFTVKSGSTSSQDIISALSGNTSNYAGVSVGRSASEGRLAIPASAGQFAGGAAAGDVVLRVDDSAKKLHLAAGSTEILTITSAAVGIGTPTPGYLSEFLKSDATVGRTGAIGAEIVVTNSSVANSVTQSGIRFRTSDTGTTTRSAARILGSFLAGTYPDSALIFQTVSASEAFQDVMTLRGVNVGIGTTAPTAKLDVTEGYFRARDGSNIAPTSGSGLELVHTGGSGYMIAYSRDASTYHQLNIYANPLILNGNNAGSVSLPPSSGTALFGIDTTLGGSTLAILNNATATPFSNAANFSGMIIVQDTTINGGTGLFIVGGNTVLMVGNTPANTMTHTAATASRVNVYSVAGVLTIENKLGSTATLRVFAIRTRTT